MQNYERATNSVWSANLNNFYSRPLFLGRVSEYRASHIIRSVYAIAYNVLKLHCCIFTLTCTEEYQKMLRVINPENR